MSARALYDGSRALLWLVGRLLNAPGNPRLTSAHQPKLAMHAGPIRTRYRRCRFSRSHLVDRLMQAGEEVLCLDNTLTGRKANAPVGDHPSFEFIRHDVTEPIKLEVDRIWHLACPASPIHYQSNPVKTAKTSFLGTYNMLGLARRVNARLLLASTSEVYGDPVVHPQPESYRGCVNPIGVRAC